MKKLILAVLVVTLTTFWACRPSVSGSGDHGCDSDSDCHSGEICNPTSFKCVSDVNVARDHFAGSFEFIFNNALEARQPSTYVKANIMGQEYVMHNFLVANPSSNGNQFLVESGQILPDGGTISLKIAIPSNFLAGGANITLSDGLDVSEGIVGSGLILRGEPMPPDNKVETASLPAQIETGTLALTDFTAEVGGLVAGKFEGTLMPTTAYKNTLGLIDKCGDNELLDPKTTECLAAFDGYDMLAGMDSVYESENGLEKDGWIVTSYRLPGEEVHYELGGCVSWKDNGNIIIGGLFQPPEKQRRYMEVYFPETNLEVGTSLQLDQYAAGNVFEVDDQGHIGNSIAHMSSGQVTIRHFRDGPRGRLLVTLWAQVQ